MTQLEVRSFSTLLLLRRAFFSALRHSTEQVAPLWDLV
jgi:hypothetical protein